MDRQLRILLADDSRFFRTIEAKFLQNTPAEILEADSCEVTLSLARQVELDLIYMAASLYPSGGIECCTKLKSDPQLKRIPVVIICDQEDAQAQSSAAHSCGCDDILVKPLDRHQFIQIGRKYLSGIREHRQPKFFPLVFHRGGEGFTGKCLDLSGGGLFLETQEDLQPGTRVELQFKLPGASPILIHCQAEVMWANYKPHPIKPHYPKGYGLKFVDLPADIHRLITQGS